MNVSGLADELGSVTLKSSAFRLVFMWLYQTLSLVPPSNAGLHVKKILLIVQLKNYN